MLTYPKVLQELRIGGQTCPRAYCITGLGFGATRYVKTAYEGGQVIFTIRQERGDLRCAACGSPAGRPPGIRRCVGFAVFPSARRPVQIVLEVPRVGCPDCGEVRQVPLDFADERRSYTQAFERYVLELSQRMTIRDVAEHLQVGWDLVKDIQHRYLSRKFRRIKLKHLRQIAIDEIAIGRGHRYLTVVLDLESGAVVFVGDGKGADALKPFWKRLKRSRAKIEAVAMDMSPAYISAVQTNLPQAVLVFDHFHIHQLFNEKLSDLRRQLYREATEQLHKDVLKGTRWLLAEEPREPRPDPRRIQTSARGVAAQSALGHRLLHEGGSYAGCGNNPIGGRPTRAGRLDSPSRKLRHPDAAVSSLTPWRPIAAESSTTIATASPPDRSKEPTPRSGSCNAKPTAFETRNSSNSRSTACTKPAMNWSEESRAKYAKTG